MPQTRSRIVGSGFTSFAYNGHAIALLDSVTDSGQDPITPAEGITPLGEQHAIEIATSRVLAIGTLTLTIRELWDIPVWQSLFGLEGTANLVDVYNRIAASPIGLTCQMTITPPGSNTWRVKVYQNCVVTYIDTRENITVGALTFPKNITVAYTHTTLLNVAAAA
jgi:hypothetical protein